MEGQDITHLSPATPDTYARRHDMDVESALKATNPEIRNKLLRIADRTFLRNMDKIGIKNPVHWLASRAFYTGLQNQHYMNLEGPPTDYAAQEESKQSFLRGLRRSNQERLQEKEIAKALRELEEL